MLDRIRIRVQAKSVNYLCVCYSHVSCARGAVLSASPVCVFL